MAHYSIDLAHFSLDFAQVGLKLAYFMRRSSKRRSRRRREVGRKGRWKRMMENRKRTVYVLTTYV